jgi:hypothetical protein
MAASTNWDALYAQYVARLPRCDMPSIPAVPTEVVTLPYVAILSHPTEDDMEWLTRALLDPQQKWFVVGFVRAAASFAETLFAPVLNAAIDETNPSLNRDFIEPCVRVFGVHRVTEYLFDVVERGTDFQKAGAVNALYWAHESHFPDLTLPNAMAESRTKYEHLAAIWKRGRGLLLRTFLSNPNVDVRRSVIAALDMDSAGYDPTDQPLIQAAITIARSHDDPYIRHRIAVSRGEENLLQPLPYREE